MSSFLNTTLQKLTEIWIGLPDIAQAGLIIVFSIFCAVLAGWILTAIIGRWVGKTKTTLDDELISLLHRPVFLIVVLVGLGLAAERSGMPAHVMSVTVACLKTIGIIAVCTFLIQTSRIVISSISQKRDRFQLIQPRTVPLFSNLSLLIIIGAGIYFLFIAWQTDPTAWLASAGIIGLALSFAAKDSLANLFAGAFILADAPYKLGDFIILDSGERGKVTAIGLRSTRMLTRDDVEITIPNAVMGNTKITNESGGPYEKERIRIRVGVAYGTDVDRVEELLLNIALSHEEIVNMPEPRVRFRAFGESSLNLELLAWIKEPVLRGKVSHLITKEIYNCFNEEGIEIPFPKRDVYIRSNAARNPEILDQ